MTARSLRRALPRFAVLSTAAGAALVLGFVAPASAHVHADPAAIQHGSTGELAFSIEHGCEESPTVGMELRFPAEFTDLAPMAKEGWEASVNGQVVSFTGGSVPDGEESAFAVEVTAPDDAGDYYVAVVQTCEEGALRWIEIPAEGAAEPEFPAVEVKVTEGEPTAEDLAHGEEGGDAAHAEGEKEGDDHGGEAGAEGEDHGGEVVVAPLITNVDGDDTGFVAAGAIGAVTLVGVGAAIASDRKRGGGTAGGAHH